MFTDDVPVFEIVRIFWRVDQEIFVIDFQTFVKLLGEENFEEIFCDFDVVEFLNEEGHCEEKMVDFDRDHVHFLEIVVGHHEGLENAVNEETLVSWGLGMWFQMKNIEICVCGLVGCMECYRRGSILEVIIYLNVEIGQNQMLK